MPSIGPLELIVILVIVLVVFGPKRLPQLGRQLGSGMREFKDSITSKADRDDDDDEPARPALTKAQAPDPATTNAPTPTPAEPSTPDPADRSA